MRKKKFKDVSFLVESYEVKQNDDGSSIGIVKGYASTFGNTDRVGDTFAPTAFDNTIKDHFRRNNRGIRILYNHDRDKLLGHAPIEFVRVDAKGLFIEAHLNLEVMLAADVYSFVKQGVLRDFSVGYYEKEWNYNSETEVFTVLEADLLEVSIVTEPCNQAAEITEVKHVSDHTALALGDRELDWNPLEADVRVRAFLKDEPLSGAFLWTNEKAEGDEPAVQFPIADVVDGKLVAVPKALFHVASMLKGLRPCPDVSESDRMAMQKTISKYYATMGMAIDFDNELTVEVADVESIKQLSDVEELLEALDFSKNARKAFISKVRELTAPPSRDDSGGSDERDAQAQKAKALESIQALTNFFNKT